MPLVAVGDVVLVGRATVEHVVVVDELHLAGLEVHVDVEVGVVGQRGDPGDGLAGGGAQPRRVGVALRGENVLGDEADEEPAGVLGEARDAVERRRALGLLASRVVGQWFVECGGQFGRLAHELVVDRHRVGDARQSTSPCRAQAEQAHQVGTVGVVVECDAAELVAADGGVVDRLALVGDVAQDVAVFVLRPGLAEMQPDAPVEQGEVVVAVALGVEGGDAGEAAAVEEDVDDAIELGRQLAQREVVPPELQGVGALGFGRQQRRIELRVVLCAQPERPRLGFRDVGRPPFRLRFELVEIDESVSVCVSICVSMCGSFRLSRPRSRRGAGRRGPGDRVARPSAHRRGR